jgi:GTP-binding protein
VAGFVDECMINARGGDGGAGAVSTRREAHVPKGGPDGGDGGKGGDVWLVADRNMASLLVFADHPHRRAQSGQHGQGKKRHGSSGADLEVAVPEGTVVFDRERKVLADLVHAGDRYLAAAGGQGGRGNARFLSNKRRAPSFAEQGEHGEEHWLVLELKLMADVALVGFPNVGKSTLISRISAAKPKIADYPFTTLEPNLGVVRLDDGFEYVVADIPGLIEGASDGRGLGHRFLRHVERARVLVLLVDLAGGIDGTTTPADQEATLLRELGAYQPELLERPRLVVGSRLDLVSGDDDGGANVELRISAVTGCRDSSVGWATSCAAHAPTHPWPRPSWCTAPWGRGSGSSATTTAATASSVGRPSGPWRCRTSPTPMPSTSPTSGCASWASIAPWRGPAPRKATPCTSVASRSTTSSTPDQAILAGVRPFRRPSDSMAILLAELLPLTLVASRAWQR